MLHFTFPPRLPPPFMGPRSRSASVSSQPKKRTSSRPRLLSHSVRRRSSFDEHPPPRSPSFPSESEIGGYYEEDLGIYDDYRYSRYSMMSRKSRKSVIPDPKAALDQYPLPAAPRPPASEGPSSPHPHSPHPMSPSPHPHSPHPLFPSFFNRVAERT